MHDWDHILTRVLNLVCWLKLPEINIVCHIFFITLVFASRFNPICGQLGLNEGPIGNRVREGKRKINYLIGLTRYGLVHYLSYKFSVLTRIDTICLCFLISLPHFVFQFNALAFFVFTFKLELDKTEMMNAFLFF